MGASAASGRWWSAIVVAALTATAACSTTVSGRDGEPPQGPDGDAVDPDRSGNAQKNDGNSPADVRVDLSQMHDGVRSSGDGTDDGWVRAYDVLFDFADEGGVPDRVFAQDDSASELADGGLDDDSAADDAGWTPDGAAADHGELGGADAGAEPDASWEVADAESDAPSEVADAEPDAPLGNLADPCDAAEPLHCDLAGNPLRCYGSSGLRYLGCGRSFGMHRSEYRCEGSHIVEVPCDVAHGWICENMSPGNAPHRCQPCTSGFTRCAMGTGAVALTQTCSNGAWQYGPSPCTKEQRAEVPACWRCFDYNDIYGAGEGAPVCLKLTTGPYPCITPAPP